MPDYQVSVDQPNRPDGDEIEVFPFGVVKNRQETVTFEMEREQAEYLASGYGVTVKTSNNSKVKPKAMEEAPEVAVIDDEGGEDK